MYRFETNELSGMAMTRVTIPAKADHPRTLHSSDPPLFAQPYVIHSLVEKDGSDNDLERSAVDIVGRSGGVADSTEVR